MQTIEQEILACERLSDDDLWAALPRLAKAEREDLALFLIHLRETARRDLHLRHAYSGLFKYLLTLGFSDWEARARAVATAAGHKYPSIFTLLRSGQLNLTSLVMIAPHLTSENHQSLLGKACRRSTREVQALVAELAPQAPRRDVIRVVCVAASSTTTLERHAHETASDSVQGGELFPPAGSQEPPALTGGSAQNDESIRTAGAQKAPAPGPKAARLRFAFDAPEEFEQRLRRARDLLRHKYPFGKMAHILFDALEALLDRIDPERRIARRQMRARRKRARAAAPRASLLE